MMIKSVVAALVLTGALAPLAHADPSDPAPPVLPGPASSQLPGNQPLPAICRVTMIACAEHYSPDRGSYVPNVEKEADD